MIPYGRQSISEADIDAVVAVLRSEFLTQGPAVPLFESVVAKYCGARHAVAVNSATSALHIACLALDVGPGDLVWTSPITFVASANCARFCGADVDWVDIDPDTYNLSPDALEAKLVAAEQEGRLPKVVIPVHLAGQSCDMERIHELSLQYGFRIIEDASHAIGGSYMGKPVGSCEFSDITVFSFHPVKVITTGEGGTALTNDDSLGEKMALLRVHGITKDAKRMTQNSHGPWYYEQVTLGFNYRMTDIQAALGASQMTRLDTYVGKRNALAARYDEAFADLPLTTPHLDERCVSARHLYIIRLVDPDKHRHRTIFDSLRSNEIGVNLHYIPVYRQPDFVRQYGEHSGLVEAEAYYASAISLPMFPTLSEADQSEVIRMVRVVMAREGCAR